MNAFRSFMTFILREYSPRMQAALAEKSGAKKDFFHIGHTHRIIGIDTAMMMISNGRPMRQ